MPPKSSDPTPRRRRSGFRAGAATGALSLLTLALLVAPGSSSAAGSRPAALYWGAQIGSQMTGEEAPWDMRPVRRFEKIAGKGLSLVQFGAPFADCTTGACIFGSFPSTPLDNVRRYGAIPIFSWNSTSSPEGLDQPAFSLSTLINGTYDAYIREFATKAREWGHPFFLRFNWEMNGFWFPWSPGVNGNQSDEFIAAWRHVHDIFTSVGATNATWVWCPNVDLHGVLTPLSSLYPGDDYVDWTGIDGFNWGKRRGSPGWQSFNQVYHRTYRQIVRRIAPGKPLMISEIASSDRGGSKRAWIKNMLAEVRHRYRKVRGLVWYDVDDRGTNWPIEKSKRSRNAFRRGIRSGAYRPNLYGGIGNSPIQPPAR
ncbi:MAG TPA: glycosyl hydrolase [Solirubrobacterales bacterium]|nr:glycosyl hydrolase [Solirubrobacterales bacterium]